MDDESTITRVIKWTWRIGVQIFYFAIVLIVFSLLEGRVERIVTALGGIIFVAVASGIESIRILIRLESVKIRSSIATINASIASVDAGLATAPYVTEAKEIDEDAKPVIVRMFGAGAISLLCLFELFSAIT